MVVAPDGISMKLKQIYDRVDNGVDYLDKKITLKILK